MTDTIRKHFVTFYSPGTFMAEDNTVEIASWDVPTAIIMAGSIKQRYNATPYGFRFSTRERGPDDLDSKVTERSSGTYYLGGKIETLAEIEARNDPNDAILIQNMKSNGYDKVIVNTNSWKWTQPFTDKDVLLEYTP